MPDLMAALEASIAAAKRQSGKPKEEAAARKNGRPARATAKEEDRGQEEVGGRGQASRWRSRGAASACRTSTRSSTRGRVHQGPGDRLLHARGAGRCCRTCATAPLTLKRYPERGRRPVLLREAAARRTRPTGSRRRRSRPATEDDRLLRLRRPADARLGGQPRGPRAAPLAVEAETRSAPDDDGLRPRPRRAGRRSSTAAGGAAAARHPRASSASSVSRRPRARRACRSTCR